MDRIKLTLARKTFQMVEVDRSRLLTRACVIPFRHMGWIIGFRWYNDNLISCKMR